MDTMEENGELVFLYQLIDGVTDNSHALYTAMLAGIPQDILDRVTQVYYTTTTRTCCFELVGKYEFESYYRYMYLTLSVCPYYVDCIERYFMQNYQLFHDSKKYASITIQHTDWVWRI